MQYAVVIHAAEEGGYWSEIPALPGCTSQGDTLDETLANTREAVETWISYLREKGDPVPTSSDLVVTIDVAA